MGSSSSRRSTQKSLKLREGKNDNAKGDVKLKGAGHSEQSKQHSFGEPIKSENAVSKEIDAKQRRVSRVKAWENSPGRTSLHSGRDSTNNIERTSQQIEDKNTAQREETGFNRLSGDRNDQLKSSSELKGNPGELLGKDDITSTNSSVVTELPPVSPLPGQTSGIDLSAVITDDELYNYLCEGSATPHIYDPTYMLLIDTREMALFKENHIVLARSSASLYPDLLASNVHSYVRDENQIGSLLREFALVVVYGAKVLDMNNRDLPEVKMLSELAGYGLEPVLFNAGFDSFSRTFPFLCTTQEFKTDRDLRQVLVYPSVLLTDQLYQGRGDQATNAKVVDNLKITHIVNISREHANAFPGRLTYLTIKLDDISQSNLQQYFSKSNSFIEDALAKGGRVLVHCNMGVSRSSTISIAYLMKTKQWTLKTAYDFVKEKRTCICPNRGFLFQLLEWEEMLFGKKQTNIDDLWF